ncbi:MAG: anaerobic ribonucleoside-triphosphate reductase activating protein [Treponema sp.]|nr:anaerobic ribonucleoside-triphosphate reductase activating protein [Treponema sp.]
MVLPKKIVLRKTSLVDYPGKVSSVFFISGCNLRCPWCHNPELLSETGENYLNPEECLAHIYKRRGIIDALVLSGGEPCFWDELPSFIIEIKKTNPKILIKLDTNGMFPGMLEKLFSCENTRPGYIAMDLKMAPERYKEIIPSLTVIPDPAKTLKNSIFLIRESKIEHEFRSLALPSGFFTERDIDALSPLVGEAPWYLRPFRGGNCLDPAWNPLEEPEAIAENRIKFFEERAGKQKTILF